jgi:hypothetical protein
MNVQCLKPLTLREAVFCDFLIVGVELAKAYPGDTPGQTRNRFSNLLAWLTSPETAPPVFDVLSFFPTTLGLYPNVHGCSDKHVRDQLVTAVADLLATQDLIR